MKEDCLLSCEIGKLAYALNQVFEWYYHRLANYRKGYKHVLKVQLSLQIITDKHRNHRSYYPKVVRTNEIARSVMIT